MTYHPVDRGTQLPFSLSLCGHWGGKLQPRHCFYVCWRLDPRSSICIKVVIARRTPHAMTSRLCGKDGSVDLLGLSGPEYVQDQRQPIYSVHLEGNSRHFITRIPCDVLCDLSDKSETSMFLYGWMDSKRGQGAHVRFDPTGMEEGLESAGEGSPCHTGNFSMTIQVFAEDMDLLKLMSCVRIKDKTSGNYRTDVVACGAVRLDRLLMGSEEKAVLTSVFDTGNYTEVHMRARNADQFENSRAALLPVDDFSSVALPRITFFPSVMWRMDELCKIVDTASDTLTLQMDKCNIKGPEGGDMFLEGKTRWDVRTLNHCLCIFSIFLGTPGCALAPLLIPVSAVSSAAGSSAGRRSKMVRSPSHLSSRITRS